MIAILDYGAGNLRSVKYAFDHLGADSRITADPEEIRRADRLVFPGVGAAGWAMDNLKQSGLDVELRHVIKTHKPLLGICIGMQLVFEYSHEDGGVDCLGILPGRVERFRPPRGCPDKVPHMGWNTVTWRRPHPLFEGIEADTHFYFVHSYYVTAGRAEDVVATADYADTTFTAGAARDSALFVQFHPEKSGRPGLRLLSNFMRWRGNVS